MTAMLETIADDLIARFKKRVETHAGMPFEQTGVSVPSRDIWLDYARAALEAMRVPSEEMKQCAIGAGWHGGIEGDAEIEMEFGEGLWTAMIDAALHKEG